jgi:lysophospholipase L1-like esterase
VFDFKVRFSHFALKETRFRLQTPGQRREDQKRFPIGSAIISKEEIPVIRNLLCAVAAALLLVSSFAHAAVPWTFSNDTRYLAMGDSLAAGLGAIPVTQGYAYLLYKGGTFDSLTNTIFVDAGMPGATSAQVLAFQVQQATDIFQPDDVTISVGGNDLLEILNGADPVTVLTNFQANLVQILGTLRANLPKARIIIGNQYDIPEITASIPGATQVIAAFNAIIAGVAQATGVRVADVFDAFQGRTGLLLIERHGASAFEVHPTNAGYRVMADAFAAVSQ